MNNLEINAFGLKIHPWTIEGTINIIESNIKTRHQNLQHIVVNAAKIVYSRRDKGLRNAINNSDIVNIDGMAVVWALRLLGYDVPERVSGIDLFLHLLYLASEKGYRVYFLGAKPYVLDDMVNNLKNKFPNLQIAGYHHGYFQKDDYKDIARQIKCSKADLLFLGITSPKKELFLDKYTDYMNIPFSMGVGGSFDIIAGRTKRAPDWMQKTGMEWLYRIIQEPGRMWKRYLVTNTIFIYLVFKSLITGKDG